MNTRLSLTALLLAGAALLMPAPQASVVVRMETVLGDIDLWLYDDLADTEVANFLSYVDAEAYHNTFVHRSVPGFVIQGGGFAWDDNIAWNSATLQVVDIPKGAPILHRYILPNVRGTIAMARQGGSNPNTATNQWFINLVNNTTSLAPNQYSTGYMVFGSVLGDGMDVADAIAALSIEDQSAVDYAFNELPLVNHTPGQTVTKQNLALITDIRFIASGSGDATPVMGASGDYSFLNFMPNVLASSVGAQDNPSPGDAPEDVIFHEGFFSFTLSYVTGPTSVALSLPEGQEPNTYYKYGPTPDNHTPHWYEFMYDGETGAILNGNIVGLVLVDGARGDDDLEANGTIVDVGGPGVAPVSGGGGGGGGGGGAVDILSLLTGLFMLARRRYH